MIAAQTATTNEPAPLLRGSESPDVRYVVVGNEAVAFHGAPV